MADNKLTQAQIDEICVTYDWCRNQLTTAKITKHSAATVNKYLIANGRGCGAGNNSPRQKISDAELIEAVKTMTTMEIVKHFSIHETNVLRRCKKLGIRPLGYEDRLAGLRKNWGKKNANLKSSGICGLGKTWHYVESHDRRIKTIRPGFRYLESKEGSIRLKCCKCGEVIERNQSTIRRSNIIQCEFCQEKEKQKKEMQEKRTELVRIFYAIKEKKTPKECIVCGQKFFSQYAGQKYCSDKCRKKRKSRNSSIRHRCRRYGVYYDPTVTPEKVFERDRYTCMICGLACNKGDNTWSEWLGPYSPTVDHIKALKNGGTHTWDNVQCAHAICNSYKRDLFTV